jgi:hypothetical protein
MVAIDEISRALGRIESGQENIQEDLKHAAESRQMLYGEVREIKERLVSLEMLPKRVDGAEEDIKGLQRWRWHAGGVVTLAVAILGWIGFKH